jgi:hypothetical protein
MNIVVFKTVIGYGFSARPKVSAPLPSGDKNTVVHGSQADSGVFTMGSQLNGVHHQQQQPFHPNGNVYDGRNEPYNGLVYLELYRI